MRVITDDREYKTLDEIPAGGFFEPRSFSGCGRIYQKCIAPNFCYLTCTHVFAVRFDTGHITFDFLPSTLVTEYRLAEVTHDDIVRFELV